MHTHYQFPRLQAGYPLEGGRMGWLSVIVPVERTNRVTNPSLEKDTTGYTAKSGGTLTRATTYQRRGIWSGKYDPAANTNDGVYYAVTLPASTLVAFSADLLLPAGVPYRIYIADTGGNQIGTPVKVRGAGYSVWLRPNVLAETGAGTSYRLYIEKDGSASTASFYFDGLQCEDGSVTTYIDGDQLGFVPNQSPPAYRWTGAAHASTSVRSGQTRAGGRVMNLKEQYGYLLQSVAGGGMEPKQNISNPNPVTGGSVFLRNFRPDRALLVPGTVWALSFVDKERRVRALENALRDDYTAYDQPLVLRYLPLDERDQPLAEELEIICHYESGLEGALEALYHEGQIPLRFTIKRPPGVYEIGDRGASLNYSTTASPVAYIAERSPGGVWNTMNGGWGDTGLDSPAVYALLYGTDNLLYSGGYVINAGGNAAIDYIGSWGNGTWAAMAGWGQGAVFAMARAPDGSIIVAGSAVTTAVRRWRNSAWEALGAGISSGEVYAVAVADNGLIYAGGNAAMGYLKVFDGTNWSNVGGVAPNGTVRAIATSGTKVFITGDFTSVGAVSANRAAVFDGTNWSALGSGLNGIGRAILVDTDGSVIIGGDFTTAGGIACAKLATWNGTTFTAWPVELGGGNVYGLYRGSAGLYVYGTITTAGSLSLPDHVALWTGATWEVIDIDLPGTTTIYAVAERNDGTLVIGFGSTATGSASVSGTTTITNGGTAATYPTVKMTGPGTLYQIANLTTNRRIDFGLTLNSGEEATLVLDPLNFSFGSTFRASLANTIRAGSDLADFMLLPGSNSISAYMAGTDGNTKLAMQWRTTHHSLRGGIR